MSDFGEVLKCSVPLEQGGAWAGVADVSPSSHNVQCSVVYVLRWTLSFSKYWMCSIQTENVVPPCNTSPNKDVFHKQLKATSILNIFFNDHMNVCTHTYTLLLLLRTSG